ncbi:hypothetical protein OWR29_25220 [Actinoplanes sp. Pm04-4]|uniref:Uncharacterized protein n=1 Tax=Paractinoplanes pyxinae TaxID=2997416 RepID=A0ABT4B5I4_9ACTN|nr:hypothetical protein [Actinoplanes pyxinae]MCY1141312.1 hypothetical protein [Actinoplanes pyxinae]
MTTDQPASAAQEQPADRPNKKPAEPDPPVKTSAGGSPKEAKRQEGPSQEGKVDTGGQPAESTEDAAAQRPAGTDLMKAVLTRTSEHLASEHALANANIALQINNLVTQASAPRKTSVGTDTLNRVRRTFVAPQRFLDAWEVLADRHLLLVSGSPGEGREHLATFVLDAFCDARVRRLGNGTLAEVAEADLTIGGGHLWLGAVGEFDQRAAETLAERLRKADGYLIAIWPDDRACPPELSDYVAEPGRPDLDAVIRKHSGASAVELIDEHAVVEVRQRLSGARQAARLAKLLEQVSAGRKTLDVALGEVDDPTGEVADWFGDLPGREDRAFALALAALDELSLPSVVAGARLADQLIQQSEDPEGRFGLQPFLRPSRALLTSIGADLVPGKRETGYGEVPIISVRLRRRGHAREILDAVWQSFPYLQEIYLDWMNTLARNQDPYVRERVALVAGLLAAHDFEFLRSRLLVGWAVDDDPRLRRAAATALRPPALNEQLREIVWRMLDEWAIYDEDGTDSQARLRLTAATALGAPVGGTDPGRALDLISQRLLSHATNLFDYEVWTATALAVSELFGDGGSPTSDAVLRRSAEWAETKEAGPSNVAVTVLLGLAGKSPDRASADDRRLPPLLRAVGRSTDNLEHAAILWRLALGHSRLAPAALRGLRRLTKHVGEEADGAHELTTLVLAIPSTDRELRTLRFESRRWAEDEHLPTFTALYETLSRRSR